MTGRLQNKIALITGAGSVGPGWGNGKAIATLFAREGATVIGCDRSLKAAQETADIIKSEGHDCTMHQADVTDPDAIAAMVNATLKQFGRIDVLINNVGIVAVGGAIEFSLEEWRKVLDVNLTSMFLMCKAVLPAMKQQGGGSIVNIGSIAGIRYTGVPYISYAATKSGVLGLSRSVALQHARDGIRSNVVMPGLMKTPFVVEPLKGIYGKGNVDDMMKVRDEQCPMGHMGDAWDVAYASLFLASDEAKYVTGTELVVDGGITAKFA